LGEEGEVEVLALGSNVFANQKKEKENPPKTHLLEEEPSWFGVSPFSFSF